MCGSEETHLHLALKCFHLVTLPKYLRLLPNQRGALSVCKMCMRDKSKESQRLEVAGKSSPKRHIFTNSVQFPGTASIDARIRQALPRRRRSFLPWDVHLHKGVPQYKEKGRVDSHRWGGG